MNSKRAFRYLCYISLLLFVSAGLYALGAVLAEQDTDPRETAFPSSEMPDQLCLTWSDSPQHTQTIQWRTSPAVRTGQVQYHPAAEGEENAHTADASLFVLKDSGVINDPVNHRFTAVLRDLIPGTVYRYRVGAASRWSDWSEFVTAPAGTAPFSFVYLGDPQVGFDQWSQLLQSAITRCPDAAFYAVAGDQVNRGTHRNEWDELFRAATGIFDRRPYVPAPGNHDYARRWKPKMYLDLLTLPENAPVCPGPELSYAFHYSNALFVVLDSNRFIRAQKAWLEEQLKNTKATWKFAIFHHPAYSSKANRDNRTIRKVWGSLFDTYHVDMALQGHDHGYLRTKPMHGGLVAASPAEGTVYVVSVSGAKRYAVGDFSYAEKTLDHTATWQHIDIQTEGGDVLTYRAYTQEGTLVDELTIRK